MPPPPVRWDRRTMSQSRHRTSLGVTGCRKEIAKDRDNVARMSRDVARMSRCRGVSLKIVRDLEFTKRQQSRRLRATLPTLQQNPSIPPDWGVANGDDRTDRAFPRRRQPLLGLGVASFCDPPTIAMTAPSAAETWRACSWWWIRAVDGHARGRGGRSPMSTPRAYLPVLSSSCVLTCEL